ncbi:MAG: hypothetical protein LC679_14525 [Intrasporangiaceae bacterium]|nr:hypothetical protein [Intrasporangiaceae bacterium]
MRRTDHPVPVLSGLHGQEQLLLATLADLLARLSRTTAVAPTARSRSERAAPSRLRRLAGMPLKVRR